MSEKFSLAALVFLVPRLACELVILLGLNMGENII